MLRSRCALSSRLGGAARSIRLRAEAPLNSTTMGVLHPSLVLFSTRSTTPNPADLHTATPSGAATADSASPAPAAPQYATPHTHENVFAEQATAALNSLFGTSRQAAAAFPTAASTTEETTGDASVTQQAPSQRTEHHHHKNIGAVVSHGEEEMEEDRARPAGDWASPDPALYPQHSSAPVQSWRHKTAAPSSASRSQQDSECGGSEQRNAQHPVNLQNAAYGEEMSAVLYKVATQRAFFSPVWSSKSAFEQIGAEVVVADEEGVLLATSTTHPIRLFNLEQTTLAERLRFASGNEVRAYVFRHKGNETQLGAAARPLCVSGSAISRARAAALAASPEFFTLQSRCPYWVTAEEVLALNAAVRQGEEEKFMLVPRNGKGNATLEMQPANRAASFAACAMADVSNRDLEQDGAVRVYNLSQLQDDSGRFAQLPAAAEKLARCYSIRGSRYTSATTWLMWEYCMRYHFPVETSRIVMLTAERIRGLGGTVLQEKRHPQPQALTTRERTFPVQRGGDIAAPDDGVVPPPFTMLVQDEVISLYNALQTDIAELVFKVASEQRNNRFKTRFESLM